MASRTPAVAGTFYPDDAAELRGQVAGLIAEAGPAAAGVPSPRALVAPHAGYVFSGSTAAAAFARLAGEPARWERVAVLGPSHYVTFAGLALPKADVDAFATPLGEVPLDPTAGKELDDLPAVVRANSPHLREHSLEVELPFLQHVLGSFDLVPLAVGEATTAEVAAVIERLDDERTLFVISTDLSHYLPYERAQEVDAATARAVEALEPEAIGERDACGCVPLRGLLAWARAHELAAERLALRNSGDTAGPRQGVVGYGAWGFA